ncbi:MAG: hypothetical protein KAG56_07550 [Sulfurovaceae bacterium]|nr:hypothetical protein [Sulfurovaceae bacterium]
MKSLKAISVIGGIIALIVTLFLSLATKQQMVTLITGNIEKKPLTIILNHYQDSECGMVIDSLEYASQVVAPNGNTWFFHDHGGMVDWLDRKSFKNEAILWIYAKDTKKWIDTQKAWYSRDEKTPMLYGFGAYEQKKEKLIDFKTMQLHMLRGEHMANPTIRQQLEKGR